MRSSGHHDGTVDASHGAERDPERDERVVPAAAEEHAVHVHARELAPRDGSQPLYLAVMIDDD